MPRFAHRFDSILFRQCQIIELGSVLLKVIKLPFFDLGSFGRRDSLPYQLPSPLNHEGIVFMLREHGFAALQGLSRKRGSKGDSP